jgi:hypothetical protein
MVEGKRDCSADEPPIRDPFEVVSIRSVGAPPGLPGDDWFRYVIRQGHNRIIGFRAGDKANVTCAIEDAVHRLNHRRRLKRGRTHVVLGPGST